MGRDPHTQREDERTLEDAEARKIEERERLDRLREHLPTTPEERWAALDRENKEWSERVNRSIRELDDLIGGEDE